MRKLICPALAAAGLTLAALTAPAGAAPPAPCKTGSLKVSLSLIQDSQGAGNVTNDPGITGLSDSQLKSGLPKGLSSRIWSENPNINGGLPYLIANPPPN